ncbi:MAG: acetyl-CoA carboxylase biotin carboxyl carrier protein subunit, partial [Desulfobacterales bacterium]|nr:acetyl-CoA carboxylase biotin carboxyl carrier protein subunit [Desulfobacterales bacterium]
MKVFQKIKSPAKGRIVKIVAENESALKDDDLMFVIEAAS